MGGNSPSTNWQGSVAKFNPVGAGTSEVTSVLTPEARKRLDEQEQRIRKKGIFESYITNKGWGSDAGWKIDSTWTASAFVEKPWQTGITYGARIKAEW